MSGFKIKYYLSDIYKYHRRTVFAKQAYFGQKVFKIHFVLLYASIFNIYINVGQSCILKSLYYVHKNARVERFNKIYNYIFRYM